MSQVRHIFGTVNEANAFVCGVHWVNDDAVEVIDIQVGDDEIGPRVTVIAHDADAAEEIEIDYRQY